MLNASSLVISVRPTPSASHSSGGAEPSGRQPSASGGQPKLYGTRYGVGVKPHPTGHGGEGADRAKGKGKDGDKQKVDEQHKGKDHANSKGCKSSEGYGWGG